MPPDPGSVDARVAHRVPWAPGLCSLVLDRAPPPFEPGQFVNLALPGPAPTPSRSYSLVGAPGEPVEVLVSEVPGGALSPALAGSREGDAVRVLGAPQGFFTLRWVPPAEELWMVATGTGLAPFVSMLRSGAALDRFARVVLVHGVRESAHLAYEQELLEASERSAGRLRRLVALSRERKAGALPGRVTELLSRGALEEAAGTTLDPKRSHVLLCGNPSMIDEMVSLLAERGLVKHRPRRPGHVSFEKYW